MSIGIYLCIGAVFGVICESVAARKNRSAGVWFAWGALFGLRALLVVLSLEPLPRLELEEQR